MSLITLQVSLPGRIQRGEISNWSTEFKLIIRCVWINPSRLARAATTLQVKKEK